jgi:hypothetical protein
MHDISEIRIPFSGVVAKIFRISKLSGFEGWISKVIVDAQLRERVVTSA